MSDRHQQTSYPLRMPPELREALERAAEESGRSLHAEIILRLQKSYLEATKVVDVALTAPENPEQKRLGQMLIEKLSQQNDQLHQIMVALEIAETKNENSEREASSTPEVTRRRAAACPLVEPPPLIRRGAHRSAKTPSSADERYATDESGRYQGTTLVRTSRDALLKPLASVAKIVDGIPSSTKGRTPSIPGVNAPKGSLKRVPRTPAKKK